MNLDAPIGVLHGIGPKTETMIQRLGVYTVRDILLAFPRDYVQLPRVSWIRELDAEGTYAFYVSAASAPVLKNTKRMQVTLAKMTDGSGSIQAVWYRMPYIRSQLSSMGRMVMYGRVTAKNQTFVMEQPALYPMEEYERLCDCLQPVYSLTKGISSKQFGKFVRIALESMETGVEYLPEKLLKRNHLMPLSDALWQIHFPTDQADLNRGRKRLAFDEFFLFLVQMHRFKESASRIPNAFPLGDSSVIEETIHKLPFPLTGAQERALAEIEADIYGPDTMQRLLQGDVGSGKTILAFLIMIRMAKADYQSAIMAPTEVLARQHYETFLGWVDTFGLDIPVILLTGSMTAKQKREAYARIENEPGALIIGTHALIQEKVDYRNLALVVTDEQHRFGVRQRETFAAKGMHQPHVLVMSATPIPRTLAIILYGDLDISVVDELPARRLPVKNCVVDERKRETSWNFIAGEVKKRHQAYIICPLVEENEELELEDVISYTKKLRDYFGEAVCVDYLHGKMSAARKNEIMEGFLKNKIQVLVSTTVVEVGVNVPNATVMMIENAQRFGLAQLHQLRGRVGRGDAQSYCIMLSTTDSRQAKERLDILTKSNDGFFIAGEDLKMRGPGDFFGIRQSGLMEFKLADVFSDADMLSAASGEAKAYTEGCRNNQEHAYPPLEERLQMEYRNGDNNWNL